MSDIATSWQQTFGDWSVTGQDLTSGDDLVTAVLISLFTDRVALPDDVIPDGSGDPRGWWADDATYPIGSRIWLLERAKRTQQTLVLAQGYAEEALQWLLDDDVCSAIDVYCEWQQRGFLAMQVTVTKNAGNVVTLNFVWAWTGVN
jgi:phage gp46-like protein